MTIVKRPNDEQQTPVLKVVFLLVAVLGAAFLLFKHDPYTAAVLEKDAIALKKVAEPPLRKPSGIDGQQTTAPPASSDNGEAKRS